MERVVSHLASIRLRAAVIFVISMCLLTAIMSLLPRVAGSDKVFASDPDQNENELLHQANALIESGKAAEALSKIEKALDLDPLSAKAWFLKGVSHHSLAQLNDALLSLRKAEDLGYSDPRLHYYLGLVYLDTGEIANGLKEAELLPSDFLSRADLYYKAANIYSNRAGRHDQPSLNEAIRLYRKALEIDPTLADAHFQLGLALYDLGKFQESAASFRRALELSPGRKDALENLALSYLSMGDQARAMAIYEDLLESDGDSVSIWIALGDLSMKGGLYKEAAYYYRQAIMLMPKWATAHYKLGRALRLTGDTEGASQAFKETISIAPYFVDAHFTWGDMCLEQGNIKEAIEHLKDAIDLSPSRVSLRIALGRAYLLDNDIQNAISEFRQAISYNPLYAESHYWLAVALIQDKDIDAAIEELRKVLHIDTSFKDARQLLDLLKENKS
ncbi:MAG: tetratricopeptide repeat protein [Firmicutes bacterium]|nr:tetratricopeptide repeat protein [Bacillota bacterium]